MTAIAKETASVNADTRANQKLNVPTPLEMGADEKTDVLRIHSKWGMNFLYGFTFVCAIMASVASVKPPAEES